MVSCNQIEDQLSEWIDGTLSSDHLVQSHLRECLSCKRLAEDLKSIRSSAAALEADEEPSAAVWAKIQSQLVSEGLIREGRTGFWERWFPHNFRLNLRPALAGGLISLFLVGVTWFGYNRLTDRPAEMTESALYVELKKAEEHYQQAIRALTDVSQRKLQSLDPSVAQMLNDNLATMDYYVSVCQEAVQQTPDNPMVHQYLLAAYQKKVELLQNIVNSDSL
ncbi:MAG: zf-HC2 domain-containing protein [Acidobacteriota bacterium]